MRTENGRHARLPIHWSAGHWEGSRALELVRELNWQCLDALSRSQRGNGTPRTGLIAQLSSQWQAVAPHARQRAAGIPVLLLDLQFWNAAWWRWAATANNDRWPEPCDGYMFPVRSNAELMRETVMLAWYVVRTECGAASVLLGVADEVADIILDLGLIDIERIAARHGRFLRLRWGESPQIWRELLTAATTEDPDATCDVHWHGLQLLGGEMLDRSQGLRR